MKVTMFGLVTVVVMFTAEAMQANMDGTPTLISAFTKWVPMMFLIPLTTFDS